MTNEVDVAVVGAGLAGLTAARELQRTGLRVAVLEARDRVGGRLLTEAAPDGVFIDHGGQYVGPTQHRILALAEELGVDTFRSFDQGARHTLVQGRTDLSFPSVLTAVDALERMAAELPREEPWSAPRAREWDGQTFRTWLGDNVADPGDRALLHCLTTAVFAAEPDELSLLHVLVYIRSAGSLALLTQTEGGGQERRFRGGAQLVARRLAASLGDGVVHLAAPVRRIAQSEAGVRVECDGLVELCARRAVVAVPIPLADRIAYTPALPGRRSQMHHRLSPGATIKVHCVYPTPFWRASGHSGRAFTDQGHVSVTFDNGCPDSGAGVLVAFVEADAARDLARLPAAERRAAVLRDLVAVHGAQAAEPLAFYERNWLEEEWTRGCYGGNFGPGGWTRYGEALREPFGLLHWAGAETSPIWMNYMEGAVRSGERVSAEVAAALAVA